MHSNTNHSTIFYGSLCLATTACVKTVGPVYGPAVRSIRPAMFVCSIPCARQLNDTPRAFPDSLQKRGTAARPVAKVGLCLVMRLALLIRLRAKVFNTR